LDALDKKYKTDMDKLYKGYEDDHSLTHKDTTPVSTNLKDMEVLTKQLKTMEKASNEKEFDINEKLIK
jgi:hypothetical protein